MDFNDHILKYLEDCKNPYTFKLVEESCSTWCKSLSWYWMPRGSEIRPRARHSKC